MRVVARLSGATGIAVASLCFAGLATSAEEPWGCLRAVTGHGGKIIVPCAPGDPAALSSSAQVGAAMAYLGISPGSIRFNGCANSEFSTREDPLHPGSYLITYPSSERRLLAPITHELDEKNRISS